MGRGGGLVVSVRAFYSYNPSSNPAGYLNFLYKKTIINKKEAGGSAHLKKYVTLVHLNLDKLHLTYSM